MQITVIKTLRQPEYTGENRCKPCTLLNLTIAVILSSVIARKSKLGGALAIGVSIAHIYLRGYLVPGTPTVTKRYLPPAVLRWFGKKPGARGSNWHRRRQHGTAAAIRRSAAVYHPIHASGHQ